MNASYHSNVVFVKRKLGASAMRRTADLIELVAGFGLVIAGAENKRVSDFRPSRTRPGT
jgi:hypothetical protein